MEEFKQSPAKNSNPKLEAQQSTSTPISCTRQLRKINMNHSSIAENVSLPSSTIQISPAPNKPTNTITPKSQPISIVQLEKTKEDTSPEEPDDLSSILSDTIKFNTIAEITESFDKYMNELKQRRSAGARVIIETVENFDKLQAGTLTYLNNELNEKREKETLIQDLKRQLQNAHTKEKNIKKEWNKQTESYLIQSEKTKEELRLLRKEKEDISNKYKREKDEVTLLKTQLQTKANSNEQNEKLHKQEIKTLYAKLDELRIKNEAVMEELNETKNKLDSNSKSHTLQQEESYEVTSEILDDSDVNTSTSLTEEIHKMKDNLESITSSIRVSDHKKTIIDDIFKAYTNKSISKMKLEEELKVKNEQIDFLKEQIDFFKELVINTTTSQKTQTMYYNNKIASTNKPINKEDPSSNNDKFQTFAEATENMEAHNNTSSKSAGLNKQSSEQNKPPEKSSNQSHTNRSNPTKRTIPNKNSKFNRNSTTTTNGVRKTKDQSYFIRSKEGYQIKMNNNKTMYWITMFNVPYGSKHSEIISFINNSIDITDPDTSVIKTFLTKKGTTNAILQVTPSTREILLQKSKIEIHKNNRIRTIMFKDYKSISICSTCQGYGHSGDWCKRNPVCGFCGGAHATANCDGQHGPCCVHCYYNKLDYNHISNDPYCPSFQIYLRDTFNYSRQKGV